MMNNIQYIILYLEHMGFMKVKFDILFFRDECPNGPMELTDGPLEVMFQEPIRMRGIQVSTKPLVKGDSRDPQGHGTPL